LANNRKELKWVTLLLPDGVHVNTPEGMKLEKSKE